MIIFLDFNHIYDEPYTNNGVDLLHIYDIINNLYSNLLYIVYGLNK